MDHGRSPPRHPVNLFLGWRRIGTSAVSQILWFFMTRLRPLGAVVVINIALDIANGDIVPQSVLENLLGQFLFVNRLQPDTGGDLEMPTVRRDSATSYFHFFFLLVVFFSGSFFMDGVSFAKRAATAGSRANK